MLPSADDVLGVVGNPFTLREHLSDASDSSANPTPPPSPADTDLIGKKVGISVGAILVMMAIFALGTSAKNTASNTFGRRVVNGLAAAMNALPLMVFFLNFFVDAFSYRFSWTIISITMLIVVTLVNYLFQAITFAQSLILPWAAMESSRGNVTLNPALTYKNILPASLASVCTIPGFFGVSSMRGISGYATLVSFPSTYLLLSAGDATTGAIAGSGLMAGLGAAGMVVRAMSGCENFSELASGMLLGVATGASLYMLIQKVFPDYLPFLPMSQTGGGGNGGSPILQGPSVADSSTCQQESNQDFVCHAYRNGELVS